MSAVPSDLARLREHAKAAVSTSEARAALLEADAREAELSEGEHPDALLSASQDTDDALAAYAAARAVEKRAYLAYTNPFGVDKYA